MPKSLEGLILENLDKATIIESSGNSGVYYPTLLLIPVRVNITKLSYKISEYSLDDISDKVESIFKRRLKSRPFIEKVTFYEFDGNQKELLIAIYVKIPATTLLKVLTTDETTNLSDQKTDYSHFFKSEPGKDDRPAHDERSSR